MKLLTEYQSQIDSELDRYLKGKILLAKKIDEKGVILYEVIKEFIEQGGKRLRPALFFYAYKSITEKHINTIQKIACVFELFHTFGLIHDDIIDNSDLRRNKPTVHKKYDISTAILVGDISLMLADEIFFDNVDTIVDNENDRKSILSSYNKFKQEVLIGEYLDVIKVDDVNKIMELKTAEYSFIKPVEIGLKLAKASSESITSWQKILKEVGLLFQIRDDVIGTFGSEIKIGKSVDSDMKEGKKTVVVQKFLEQATEEEKEIFTSFFGTIDITPDNMKWYTARVKEKKILENIEKDFENRIKKLKDLINLREEKYLVEITSEILHVLSDFSMVKV